MLQLNTCLLAASLALASFVPASNAGTNDELLDQVIASRSAEDRARDDARHPAQTLTFFQVEPGSTVAEVLPGRGWYTRILANYLGANGTLYGINYNDNMWSMFSFSTDKMVAERTAATAKFPAQVAGFTDNGIKAKGLTFNTIPPAAAGSVDRVLLIRALHNLNRFESKAGTRSQALSAVHNMLKNDGLVGVVQHRAPETASDEWADGSKGYLKQSAVIAMFEAAGFQLVSKSEINANPKDKPGADDMVWRLPPSLRTSKEDPAVREAMIAIGESDRMTLLFRKAL